ncbi:phytoene desaturase family protein [Staphylococcus pettenkoferi]|uniref:phytoene desaturase family protein n=1 Tax=Staphylococcus pettenkoferi TaxID=170573 RepID=UPI0022751C0E|nr:phytoene desaturase family protein [Staphylococcus pettenkoferi]MCY1619311.1 phytoene desaturase family protein [Staphylococcus pettenkoferi]
MPSKVVVIGGGLGGMSAAITLRQRGFDVTLYEKNDHLGGKLNRREQDGFGFDLGPSLLTMPKVMERLFKRSDREMRDYVDITEIPLQWRAFFPDGAKIDLYQDLERMQTASQLSERDMSEYRQFLNYAGRLDRLTEQGYFRHGLDNLRQVIRYYGPFKALQFDVFRTMQQAINHFISNAHLRDMLGYFIKYVGSSAYDAPAVLNMMAHMQHEQGVWYVQGGLHKLAQGMEQFARDIGVQIELNAEITHATTEKERIESLVVNGQTVSADVFISNMEVLPFYRHILDYTPKQLKKWERKFPPASSGYVMHLGLDKQYSQLAHHNFFFSKDSKRNYKQVFHDKMLPTDPTIYLVHTTTTNATQAPEGSDNLKILPHIPAGASFTEASYQRFRERVLDKLEAMGLEGLRSHIVSEYTLTPDDLHALYYSDGGSIYGTLSDRRLNRGFKHPKRSEVVDNLYFVGGTVNPGGGMPMVVLSGQQVGEMIPE